MKRSLLTKKMRYSLKAYILCLFFSNESSTVFYQLEFSVPPSTEGFMENTMNPDFIRNILRQNIYDEDDTFSPGTSECNELKLDPTSLTLTCKCYTCKVLHILNKEQKYLLGSRKIFLERC